MKKISIITLMVAFVSLAFNDKPAYILYDKNGKETNYSAMVEQFKSADVVFFGELHDNPIAHWLELELTKDLYNIKKENMLLGAEMFEADNQLLLDEYIGGIHAAEKFEADARFWTNYKTDYKPIMDFAKDKKIPFIATNIPRRYAALINDKGFEGLEKLSAQAKSYISPDLVKLFDTNTACYANMKKMVAEMGRSHGGNKIIKAQASKDATMAYFIIKNWSKGKQMFHLNGSYHSDNHDGILWWIKKLKPEMKLMTVSAIEQDTISVFKKENQNLADFILVIPEDMTKTNRK